MKTRTLIGHALLAQTPRLADAIECESAVGTEHGIEIDADSECYRELRELQFSPAVKLNPCDAGTNLERIIRALGFQAAQECGCKNTIRFMDRYGLDWCKDNRAMIVTRLQSKLATLKPREVAAAIMRATAKGMTFIDPKDIAGSIFDEAITRSQNAPRE